MSDAVIQVRGLVKRFGALTAVSGVSFDVKRGEIFGILGPNGAGKTTMLECIEGLLKPDDGETSILGMNTIEHPEQVKDRVGVQLQSSAYFDRLTLTEILDLFGQMYSRRVEPEKLLKMVELSEKASDVVKALSGGQKQRFTLAASLVNDPEVVFLDEPTTGLDPLARRNVWELIERMHEEGRTIVLTTHYMEEAQHLCERVAVMDAGAIIALDSPSELIRGLSTPFQIRLSTSIPVAMDDLAELPGVQQPVSQDGEYYLLPSFSTEATLPALLQWLNDKSVSPLHLEVNSATLEDVFLKLTGKDLRD
ncbi:MAG: ABC transporter ATP-binding protein [Chloroflexota bacterium]|nr:ABC transporter ATP-binding protein [Chloroflexota bacterium]